MVLLPQLFDAGFYLQLSMKAHEIHFLFGVHMLSCNVLSIVILIDSGVVGIRIFLAGVLSFTSY
jgi:hypothetical protein